jgi:hypothetical protein
LKNNILLDASASIQAIYDHIPTVHVVPMDRITSHEDWKLYVWQVNTSRTGKARDADFYKKIRTLIKRICTNEDDKLLVVGNGEDVGKKEGPGRMQILLPNPQLENGAKVQFCNTLALLGKNDWQDFNKCLIIHTPYRPPHYYPLLLKFWKPDCEINNYDLITGQLGEGTDKYYGYKNHPLLDALRESDIATLTYQAAKRIDRRANQKARVYLATKNPLLVKTLKENLKGIKEKSIIYKKKTNEKKRPYVRTRPSIYVERLEILLKEMVKGKHIEAERANKPGYYPKSWCIKKIMLKDKTHFSRYTKELKTCMRKLGIGQDRFNLIVKEFTTNN